MKTKQLATWLPCFSGFYNTIWEPEENNEMEYVNDEREKKGLPRAEYDSFQFDYDDYRSQVIKGIASKLESNYLKDFVKGIEIERLRSPREYNFANDSADVIVTLCAANEKRILKYLDEHKEEFAQCLKDSYTSRSGFISSYPNYIDGYMEGTPLEHEHKLGFILQFIAANECDYSDGIEMSLYYDVEKYLSVINYDELVNPSFTPIEVTDIKEQVKGLINIYLTDHNDEAFVNALDELNEQAKKKAIEDLRYINTDYEWWDFVYDDFESFCETIGITVDLKKTNFTLSYSQGDGCAFTASIDLPKVLESIENQAWKENYPKEEIHFPQVTNHMKRACRLISVGKVDGSAWIRQANRETSSKFENEWGVANPCKTDPIGVNKALDELTAFMEDVTRTLDKWLFDNLRDNCDYLCSDKAIIETIKANEYTFTENGKLENE